jgi:UDP-N-acetylglucosamine 2-epimerase (non-hydrolysing)
MPDLKVVSIFGTRPEAVKMAPVIQRLAMTPGIETRVIVTAQHRQMLDQVLNLFNIHPDYDLDLMSPNQSLADLTAAILTLLDPVLTQLDPDWILIQGDTTTVMTAAILGYYHHIRIGHIEAGLRTGDKWQPFPEEINRRIASVVTDLHFAPTQHSRQNLLNEGIADRMILVTGNPAIDALQAITRRPVPDAISQLLRDKSIHPGGKRLVVITAHRRENFGQPLEQICSAICQLANLYPHTLEFIYPVHLNPNVQQVVYPRLSGISNITLMDPLDYLSMIHLMQHATLVLTDSGGIQEEATGLGIPTLVLRATTERPEGVEAGTLKLVGTDIERIITETRRLLDDAQAHQSMAHAANPFGDGHAAERIVNALHQYSMQD